MLDKSRASLLRDNIKWVTEIYDAVRAEMVNVPKFDKLSQGEIVVKMTAYASRKHKSLGDKDLVKIKGDFVDVLLMKTGIKPDVIDALDATYEDDCLNLGPKLAIQNRLNTKQFAKVHTFFG